MLPPRKQANDMKSNPGKSTHRGDVSLLLAKMKPAQTWLRNAAARGEEDGGADARAGRTRTEKGGAEHGREGATGTNGEGRDRTRTDERDGRTRTDKGWG